MITPDQYAEHRRTCAAMIKILDWLGDDPVRTFFILIGLAIFIFVLAAALVP